MNFKSLSVDTQKNPTQIRSIDKKNLVYHQKPDHPVDCHNSLYEIDKESLEAYLILEN